jgi:hypothetical protein
MNEKTRGGSWRTAALSLLARTAYGAGAKRQQQQQQQQQQEVLQQGVRRESKRGLLDYCVVPLCSTGNPLIKYCYNG